MPSQHLEKLVSFESITGNEREIMDYVTDCIEKSGRTLYSGKNWVAAKLEGQESSTEALIINGHLDTVPPGDTAAWGSDPYSLTQKDDLYVGLGVSDMKSGIAAMLSLLSSEDLVPQKDLWLVFVNGEETDGVGTREFVEWFKNREDKYSLVAAIVPEPTSIEYVGLGHRGNRELGITISGHAGHAAKPQKPEDQAIVTAYKTIEACDQLNQRWSTTHVHPDLGAPTITVTAITTGNDNAANQFPAHCAISVDVRTTPEVVEELEAEMELLKKTFNHLVIEDLSLPFPPVATAPSSRIVQSLVTEKPDLRVQAFPGATDLSFMQEIASDCVVFGPGDAAQMHKVNESMPISNLDRYLRIIKELINSY